MTSPTTHDQYRDLHVLMDVVDTVRHAQEDARRVAGAVADEETLIQQVLRVYQSQGMEVDEATVREGLALMKERRFEFTPPRRGLSTRLAQVYITRSEWGRKAIAVVMGLGIAVGVGNLGLMFHQERAESNWMAQVDSGQNDEGRLRHQHETLGVRAESLQLSGSHPQAIAAAGAALDTLQRLGTVLDSLPELPGGEQALASFYEQDPDAAREQVRARRAILQEAFPLLSQASKQVSQASSLHELGLLSDAFDGPAAPDLEGLRQTLRGLFEQAMQAGDAGQASEAADSWKNALALDGFYERIRAQGRNLDDTSRAVLDDMLGQARMPLVAGNISVAQSLLEGAEAAMKILPVSYQLRIVNEPDSQTGIWRYYNNNRSQRSFFILVDALDAAGRPVTLPIRDAEVGQTVETSRFGVRVPESVYNAVGEDKVSDGIIDRPIFGAKKAGELEPTYEYETLEGLLTEW